MKLVIWHKLCLINCMYKLFYLLLLVLLLTVSCTRPEEEPQFLRIDNLGVGKISGSEATLTADAVFYNPNNVKMKLRKVAIDVALEGKQIGSINQEMATKIPALSEFIVPVNASFDLSNIGLLNGIMSILGGKKIDVHYEGFIKVSVHGYPVTVPINYDDEVKL